MSTSLKARGFRFLFWGWLLLGGVAGGLAAEVPPEAKPVIAPPSSWVQPQFFGGQAIRLGMEAGMDHHWLLIDRQVNIGTNETFVHVVRQTLTSSGVQNGSTLKFDFNPSYQTLTLHWVRLWRGTNHLNRLEADKVRVVRQERDLTEHILNGEQTAMLVLEDVRVGDIVDYAYSTQGENPVFNGRYFTGIKVQLEEPIERLFTRLVWPAERRFYPKSHGVLLQPSIVNRGETVEAVWDLRQVPGMHLEDSLPVWCDPEPWVQLTEFSSWAEVNQWALGLFQSKAKSSPDLVKKVNELKVLGSPELQVQGALRFVQDEIRYFGIEIGISADKPAEPGTVLERRFGDCKDKALLLVTLLRGLGIEAYPVLVNTEARQMIADWLPSAGVFDHCIAVVRFNGQTWWVDPTAGNQRGPLAAHYLPHYGYGLVISPLTTGLTAIPQTTGLPVTSTTEYFELGRKAGVANLKVVTVAVGRDAEALRAEFTDNKRSEIERDYTRFYAGSYPGIKLAAPLDYQDDQAQNRVQITEYFTIEGAWVKSDDDGKFRSNFYPFGFTAFAKRPVDTQRRLPLAVPFPRHQFLRTEVTVPTTWTYKFENKTIMDPAFVFHKHSHRAGNKLIIEYEYQSYADSVPAERAEEYLQNLDRMSKCFGDGFVWR